MKRLSQHIHTVLIVLLLLAAGSCASALAETLVLPESTMNIAEEAFYGDRSVTGVTLPNGVRTIGAFAFAGTSIHHIELPDSLTSIADDAFAGSNLETVTATQGSYGYTWAQRNGYHIASPTSDFDYNITSSHECEILGYHGYDTVVTVPAMIEGCPVVILENWYSNTTKYGGISHPSAHWYAPRDKIKEVYLPHTLRSLGDFAFYGFKALKAIDIPDSVTSIGNSAFYFCTSLERIDIPDNVTDIGERAFEGCEKLTSIRIPSAITEIPSGMCNKCDALKQVQIPEKVTKIGDYAFAQSDALTSIYLPKSVRTIGENAFYFSYNLRKMVVMSLNVNFPSHMFYSASSGAPRSLTIYGYEGSAVQRYCVKNNVHFVPIGLYNLRADSDYFDTERDNSVLFTLETVDNMPVELYDEGGENLGTLHDDGLDGDEEAWDNVYTLRTTLRSDIPKIVRYTARCGNLTSEAVALTFYADATADPEQAGRNIQTVCQRLKAVKNTYAGGDGCIPASQLAQVLSAAEACAEDLIAQGLALEWYSSDSAVFVNTIYGLTCTFAPQIAGKDAGGGPSASIVTLQPCRRNGYNEDAAELMTVPSRLAHSMDEFFDDFSYNQGFNDGDVTRSRVAALSKNSVILWHGHAFYNPKYGAAMRTGEYLKNGFFAELFTNYMQEDGRKGRVLLDDAGYLSITGGFIEHYCRSLEGSFVYLATCYSGKNKTLAEAFLNKGAKAVVANSDSIDTNYDIYMMNRVITYMCSVNPKTGRLSTVDEAIALGRAELGANDHVFCVNHNLSNDDPHYAYPKSFGDGDYRFDETGYVHGKLTYVSGGSPIADATVELYVNGELLRSTNSDSQGRYAIGMLRQEIASEGGSAQLRLSAKYCDAKTVPLVFAVGTVFEVDRALEYTNGTVSGYVVDAITKKNIGGATITLTNSAGVVVPSVNGGTGSTASGAYIYTAPRGTYTMTVSKAGYATERFNVTLTSDTLEKFIYLAPPTRVVGTIRKASDRSTAVPNVRVNFYRENDLVKTVTTASDGSFETTLGLGDYRVEAVASGYKTFIGYITCVAGEDNYFETFLMVPGSAGSGTASGAIVNGYTGQCLSDVSLTVYSGWNNTGTGSAAASTTSGTSGEYSLTLPIGNYTVVMSAPGYLTGHFNIVVNSGNTGNQNGAIEPELIAQSDYVIRLEWGKNPSDLDAHLSGTLPSGTSFHCGVGGTDNVKYLDMAVAVLDTDDTSSYGPEHISVNIVGTAPLYYYIYLYGGSGSLPTSEAKVSVFKQGQLLRVIHVPTTTSSARYWNVFAIKDGALIMRNTLTSAVETGYAG